MCGIFGAISQDVVSKEKLKTLVDHSRQRGKDSSGLIYFEDGKYQVERADYDISKLLGKVKPFKSKVVLGHSRLITNGLTDNQPVIRNTICVIHNGIIVNEKEIWDQLTLKREYQIDSEVIAAIAEQELLNDEPLENIPSKVLSLCKGIVACALVLPEHGKLILFSNNGSLYIRYNGADIFFASERYSLEKVGAKYISQVKEESLILDIPLTSKKLFINDDVIRTEYD